MFKKCQHCGRRIYEKRRTNFCSNNCLKENKIDRYVNPQRLNSFQALADKASWLALDNITLFALANPARKIKLLETRQFAGITYYRLTAAGYQLLFRWKSQLQVSV